jgi:hypothetical protein
MAPPAGAYSGALIGWTGTGIRSALLVASVVWFHRGTHGQPAISFSAASPIAGRDCADVLRRRRHTGPRRIRRRSLSAYQQYACTKFGPECRVALAIQRAENPQGKCEIYHYNADGTLDWGYFQINTVHLKRPGVNLRDLLDCKANIDFAYQLYLEKHGFTAWSTFKSGRYRRYLRD